MTLSETKCVKFILLALKIMSSPNFISYMLASKGLTEDQGFRQWQTATEHLVLKSVQAPALCKRVLQLQPVSCVG